MKITILGCGGSTGVPQLGGADGGGDWGACDPAEPRNRRSRASIVIEADTGHRLLVDTSPDLRSQLLACRIGRVDAILYTHAHADHVSGIDDVRSLNRSCGHPLEALGDARTLDELRRRFGYAFEPWQPPGFFRPVLQARVIAPGEAVAAAGLHLAVFEQDHGFGRSLGLRCGWFGYSTDVVALDDTAFAALAGVRVWMVGCFQRTPHKTHADVAAVRNWSARLGMPRTILTHMGPDMDWGWMHAQLPTGIEAAHDGMVIDVAS